MVIGRFFCVPCNKETNFLPIGTAVRVAQICRATIYNWMDHGWIHWSELPSGRRIICQESLLAHQAVVAPEVNQLGADACGKNENKCLRLSNSV